jgi:hypothetical protein
MKQELKRDRQNLRRTRKIEPKIYLTEDIDTIQLSERFDSNELYKSIYVEHYDNNEYTTKLLKYLNLGIKNARSRKLSYAEIDVTYKVPKIGRLNIDYGSEDDKQFFLSQMTIWNQNKSNMCRSLYFDIDMVGCQPDMLCQLMTYYGLPISHIKYFNDNRESIMEKMKDTLGWDRTKSKVFIYKLLFNDEDNINYQLKKDNIKLENIPEELMNFIKQIYTNRSKLLSHYPEIMEEAKLRKEKKGTKWNIEGCALALLAQTAEKHALIYMYKYFTSNNIHVGALIHDGLHLEKIDNVDFHIKECEKFVYKNTGFKITLKSKPFSDTFDFDVNKFNEIEGVDKLNVEIEHFKSRYVTSRNDDNIDLASKISQNQITFVKSFTGSGKTELLKQIQKIHNVDIISIVSRRSLSDKHSVDFDISHYRRTKAHSTNEVYQADSIDKIPEPEKEYILIIDEIASFCSHLLNNMYKMSRYRIQYSKKLKSLLDNEKCKMAVLVDHNINTGTIQFIRSITTRKIKLYINDFVPKFDTRVKIYENHINMKNQILECITKNEPVLVCSNSNNMFMRKVVEPLIKNLNLIENEDYLLYSGNRGLETVDTEDWKDKQIIFITPTVTYGCDSNRKAHVFGFYFNASHFDAFDCIQQISRERDPASINLYIENVTHKPINSLDEAVKLNNVPLKYLNLDIEIEDLPFIASLKNLHHYEYMRRSHHLNLRFYLIEQLKKKGYTNITFDSCLVVSEDIGSLSKAQYSTILSDIAMEGLDDKLLEMISKRCKYTKLYEPSIKDQKEFNDRYKSILDMDRTKNIIINDQDFNTFRYNMYYLKNIDPDKYVDIPEIATRNPKNKLKLLGELKTALKTIDTKDNKKDDEVLIGHDDLIDRIKKISLTTRKDLKAFYWSKLHSLLGDTIKKTVIRSDKGKKITRTYHYELNEESVKYYNLIIDITNEYEKLKKNENKKKSLF